MGYGQLYPTGQPVIPGDYPLHYHARENYENERTLASLADTDTSGIGAGVSLATKLDGGKILVDSGDSAPAHETSPNNAYVAFDFTPPAGAYCVLVELENSKSGSNFYQGFEYGTGKPGNAEWNIHLWNKETAVVACTCSIRGLGTATGGKIVLFDGEEIATVEKTDAITTYATHGGTKYAYWLYGNAIRIILWVMPDGKVWCTPAHEYAFNDGTFSTWNDATTAAKNWSQYAPLGHQWMNGTTDYIDPTNVATTITRSSVSINQVVVEARAAHKDDGVITSGYRRSACLVRRVEVCSIGRVAMLLSHSQGVRIDAFRRNDVSNPNHLLITNCASGMRFDTAWQAKQLPWWLNTIGLRRFIFWHGNHETTAPADYIATDGTAGSLYDAVAACKAMRAKTAVCTEMTYLADDTTDEAINSINSGVRNLAKTQQIPLYDMRRAMMTVGGTSDETTDTDMIRGWASAEWTKQKPYENFAGPRYDRFVEWWSGYSYATPDDPSALSTWTYTHSDTDNYMRAIDPSTAPVQIAGESGVVSKTAMRCYGAASSSHTAYAYRSVGTAVPDTQDFTASAIVRLSDMLDADQRYWGSVIGIRDASANVLAKLYAFHESNDTVSIYADGARTIFVCQNVGVEGETIQVNIGRPKNTDNVYAWVNSTNPVLIASSVSADIADVVIGKFVVTTPPYCYSMLDYIGVFAGEFYHAQEGLHLNYKGEAAVNAAIDALTQGTFAV